MTIDIIISKTFVKLFQIITETKKSQNIIPDTIRYQEYAGKIPNTAQTTHGIRNIFADIRNVPDDVPCVCIS